MRNLSRFVAAGILSCLMSVLLLAGEGHGSLRATLVSYHNPSSPPVPAISERDAEYLGTLFLPGSIPAGGIPVLENALGDIVHDSVVNILDLLRLRDIVTSQPPSPTSQELSESDLTHDGKTDQSDLAMMRDILLRKVGVPYLIDSTGGKVYGNGITLTIPPGAVDSTIVISLRRTSESEFASQWGVDTKSALQDSEYFMASFQITSSTPDFKLPFNATVKLDSVPPCAYQGLNGLFAAVPDRDGDGKSELFLINELQVNPDSLTLTTKDIAVPAIQSLSSSQIEPGKTLGISGKGFSDEIQNIAIEFRSVNTDSSQSILPSAVNDSAIVLTAPGLLSGQYKLIVHNVLTALTSNDYLIEILPPSVVSGDIRSIIVNFYQSIAASMDSVSNDSLFGGIEDSTVRNYFIDLRQSIRAYIDSTISFYLTIDDSMINTMAAMAAFLQNLPVARGLERDRILREPMNTKGCDICDKYLDQIEIVKNSIAGVLQAYNPYAANCIAGERPPGDPCFWCNGAEAARERILELTDMLAALENALWDCACRNCGGSDCDKCKQSNFIGFGPKGKISGGFGDGGFHTDGVCINIKKYNPNECATVPVRVLPFSPVPMDKPQEFECTSLSKNLHVRGTQSLTASRPHAGSIVRITNAPVPYNIVGILNDNGKAFIPHAPFNTKVTFSIYDPVTGFYDPDAGSYTTGSTAGGFDRPLLLFNPNTTIRSFSLNIGEQKHDSVSLDLQRIDYLVDIGKDDTSRLLNFSFGATTKLSLKIEDPQGNPIFDNSDVECYLSPHLRFSQTGMYRIRVAFGVAGLAGSFDLGLSVSPDPPLPLNCICGDILIDTLFLELSPFMVKCIANVPVNDTLTAEPGVMLEFESGGAVTVNGTLQGNGTPAKPITLKPADAQKQRAMTVKVPVSQRKEVPR